MSTTCEIFIPDSPRHVSVYCEGRILNNKQVDFGYSLKVDFEKCFTIYYTYNQLKQKKKKNRRLYICCNPVFLGNINKYHLNFVSKDVCIINQLRGRAFDEYKMSISYLKEATDNEVLDLSPGFFWQLSELCKSFENNYVTLELLTKKYNPTITFRRNIKWH